MNKTLKPVICGICVIISAIISIFGLNCLFALFNCHDGVGIESVAWITVICVVVFVVYLFYPSQVLILFQRYLRKRIDDQFGEASQNSQEMISKLANQRVDVAYKQDVKMDRSKIKIKKTNLQRLGNDLKTPEDLLRAIREDGRGRTCIEKAMTLCCDINLSPKNRIWFRGLLEIIYWISDGMFVTELDFKTRIRNADEILCYCDVNSEEEWPYSSLERLVSQALMRIILEAYHNSYFDLVLDAYNLLSSRQRCLGHMKAIQLSLMYELIGVIWLKRNLERGLSYLNLATEHDSQNYIAFYYLALLNFYEKRDYVQALKYANQSFAHFPENVSKDIVDAVMTIQYFCYAMQKDYFRALEIISSIDKELTQPRIVGNKAYLCFKCKDYLNAETLAMKALKMDPNVGSALNTMGMVFLHKGQYAHAIKYFTAALRFFKKGKNRSDERYFYCELCNNCAIAYYENHEEESAKEWFDKAIAAGWSYVDMKRYDALTKVKAACSRQKNDSECMENDGVDLKK